ncbi:MAG TPA: collagen-like protein [Solirubrobacterales bacterium]|jgi:hypothetical protein
MKPVRKRLTYANVMSSIAVFLVVAGGTAFAATQLGKESVGTRQLKKEAVSLAKIKTAAKNSLKGATGPAGAKGATGLTGPQGVPGKNGADGSATAYAQIESDGTVNLEHSKGITQGNIQVAGVGAYCFHDLTFNPKNAVATLLNFETGEITTGVAPDKVGGVCTVGNVNARVETYNDTGTIANKGFMVVFN